MREACSASRPVVDVTRFAQATRDSGYRSFGAAVAELVDNSLQAGANEIHVNLPNPGADQKACVSVVDDGKGMGPEELVQALQFGGSTRFDDRSGLGRYGMGLPNSSLSQARRVDVYTWLELDRVWHAYLDIDELLGSREPRIEAPKLSELPAWYDGSAYSTGTIVAWRRLDRQETWRWGSEQKKLDLLLGQRFRHFIWSGRAILVNREPVVPFDPVYLHTLTRTPEVRASSYGDVLRYELSSPRERSGGPSAAVEVQFSELPVDALAELPNRDKRRYGISKGAGASIVRAGREIDYTWVFFDKRRENYDDWWRCEIRFPPVLDELFGVSHTKQGIRPTTELKDVMVPELTRIARRLNRRVRAAHKKLAEKRAEHPATQAASRNDMHLRPLERANCDSTRDGVGGQRYEVCVDEFAEPVFIEVGRENGAVKVVVNSLHSFYRTIYEPLLQPRLVRSAESRKYLEILLLALARAQLQLQDEDAQGIEDLMREWSRTIDAFCRRG